MRRGYELIGRDAERAGCHVKQYPLCCSVAILRSVESDVAVVDFCTSVFRVTCLLCVASYFNSVMSSKASASLIHLDTHFTTAVTHENQHRLAWCVCV